MPPKIKDYLRAGSKKPIMTPALTKAENKIAEIIKDLDLMKLRIE